MSAFTLKTRMLRFLALVVAVAVSATVVAPVLATADNTVMVSIIAGAGTATGAILTLPAITYSDVAETLFGTLTLTIDDSTGTGRGWNLAILVTPAGFVYAGANDDAAIPAANFSLTVASPPIAAAGQAVDAAGGPKIPGMSPIGTLDATRGIVQANAGYGLGRYTQVLGVSLAVPARSRAGSYVGTLTMTDAAAP